MGVRGLLSTCLRRQDECVEQVDLIEVAREKNGIEILVDYYSFQQFLIYKFWYGLQQYRNNEFLRICGGEYGTLEAYITKFVKDLQALDITLLFYVDGAKGTCTETTRQKIDTWMKRQYADVEKLNQIMDVCRGVTFIQDLPEDILIRPVLLEIDIFHTLKQLGCSIIHAIAGEADYVIAKALKDRPQAYAILSNDSDFCIFKDSCFIPLELFDQNHDMKLGYPGDLPEQPLRLMVGVIRPAKVMEMLKFRNYQLLVELAVVAGNDFTGPFMYNGLQAQLDIRGHPNIQNIAGWLWHYKSADHHPVLNNAMRQNPQFCNAVQHSRNFYTLSYPENTVKPPQKGYFSQLIGERITSGTLPSNIMAMHNNFYWHRMCLEDNSQGWPCVEVSLAELRGRIYRIVLPRQECLVNEHGRNPWEPLKSAGIMASDDSDLPVIHKIQQDKIFWNLKHFHHVMSHQEEPGKGVVWFDRYGRKNGFIVYLLRYFLLQNWGRNLHIIDKEFLALAALALGRPNEKHYQQIPLRPTPRCVSIGSWFQDIYRHAYSFLGELLYLTHEFPLPREIYSGAAWTAFYTCCKDETYYMGVNQVPMNFLLQTQAEMNKIIKEKRHMIRYIVEGVFQFDDRF